MQTYSHYCICTLSYTLFYYVVLNVLYRTAICAKLVWHISIVKAIFIFRNDLLFYHLDLVYVLSN